MKYNSSNVFVSESILDAHADKSVQHIQDEDNVLVFWIRKW